MSLKNSYAYTRDTIYSCQWCIITCMPCLPYPCSGEKHWEGQIMDLREMVNFGEQSAQTLTEGNNLKSGQTVHGQNVVGKYKRNVDTPYWCFIPSCCPKQYDTIEVNGKTIAKISDVSLCCSKIFQNRLPACCSGQILVQDGNENQLGRIVTASKKKGCCVPFVSVRNPSGNQLYGYQENKDCCSFLRCCSKKYDILDGNNEQMTVGQAIKRNNICLSCCHWRNAIDITMPSKATEADKVLLLATIFNKTK